MSKKRQCEAISRHPQHLTGREIALATTSGELTQRRLVQFGEQRDPRDVLTRLHDGVTFVAA